MKRGARATKLDHFAEVHALWQRARTELRQCREQLAVAREQSRTPADEAAPSALEELRAKVAHASIVIANERKLNASITDRLATAQRDADHARVEVRSARTAHGAAQKMLERTLEVASMRESECAEKDRIIEQLREEIRSKDLALEALQRREEERCAADELRAACATPHEQAADKFEAEVEKAREEARMDVKGEVEAMRVAAVEVASQRHVEQRNAATLAEKLKAAENALACVRREQAQVYASKMEIKHLRLDNARMLRLLCSTCEYRRLATLIKDSDGDLNEESEATANSNQSDINTELGTDTAHTGGAHFVPMMPLRARAQLRKRKALEVQKQRQNCDDSNSGRDDDSTGQFIGDDQLLSDRCWADLPALVEMYATESRNDTGPSGNIAEDGGDGDEESNSLAQSENQDECAGSSDEFSSPQSQTCTRPSMKATLKSEHSLSLSMAAAYAQAWPESLEGQDIYNHPVDSVAEPLHWLPRKAVAAVEAMRTQLPAAARDALYSVLMTASSALLERGRRQARRARRDAEADAKERWRRAMHALPADSVVIAGQLATTRRALHRANAELRQLRARRDITNGGLRKCGKSRLGRHRIATNAAVRDVMRHTEQAKQ